MNFIKTKDEIKIKIKIKRKIRFLITKDKEFYNKR